MKLTIFSPGSLVKYDSKHTIYLHTTYLCDIGELTIVKKKTIIDTHAEQCLECLTTNCLHYQAFEYCSETFLESISPQHKGSVQYYVLDKKTMFFIDSLVYHCVVISHGNWCCVSCEKKCKHSSIIKEISINLGIESSPINYTSTEKYSTVSTLPIPNRLVGTLALVYQEQLSHGFTLPIDLYPEAEFCNNGFSFKDHKLQHTGIIVYMENDIHDLRGHRGK